MQIAKEVKVQLGAAKQSDAINKIAHTKELKSVKRQQDEARHNYQTHIADTTAIRGGGEFLRTKTHVARDSLLIPIHGSLRILVDPVTRGCDEKSTGGLGQ